MPEQKEKRNLTKSKIIYYMLNHSVTSKAELAKELNLSMPTVLTNVNELIAKGIIAENGEYESTGGRKAKSIGINKSYCRAMGMIITANHLEMVMVNLGYEIGFPVYFENDANAAMLAEDTLKYANAIYLSLNHTLGGAFCIDGQLVRGQNQKAGEFGHMILVPGGKKCYCGKLGCADAYCAASVLTNDNQISLEKFLEQLESKDLATTKKWEEYLDNLAILISNLRMAYDMDIILGGDVGGVLSRYMIPLGERIMAYNGFDHDVSYMKNCSYEKEASAVGVAKHFFTEYVMQM